MRIRRGAVAAGISAAPVLAVTTTRPVVTGVITR